MSLVKLLCYSNNFVDYESYTYVDRYFCTFAVQRLTRHTFTNQIRVAQIDIFQKKEENYDFLHSSIHELQLLP